MRHDECFAHLHCRRKTSRIKTSTWHGNVSYAKAVIYTVLPVAFLICSAVDVFALCSGDWGIVSDYVHSSKGEFRSGTWQERWVIVGFDPHRMIGMGDGWCSNIQMRLQLGLLAGADVANEIGSASPLKKRSVVPLINIKSSQAAARICSTCECPSGNTRRGFGWHQRESPWAGASQCWYCSWSTTWHCQRWSLPLPFLYEELCQRASMWILPLYPCRSGGGSRAKAKARACTP